MTADPTPVTMSEAPRPPQHRRHHPNDDDEVLRVAGGSDPQLVASSIAKALYDSPQIRVRAVGASAVNQAVKAIAIARGYVAPRGLDLFCRPGFETVSSREGDISAVSFRLHVS